MLDLVDLEVLLEICVEEIMFDISTSKFTRLERRRSATLHN